MPLRPQEVLELPDTHLSGGSKITQPDDDGLMPILKGLAERPPIIVVETSRAIAASDEGAILEVDPDGGTVTLTLPSTLDVGFFAQVRQISAGTVTLEDGAGATVNAFGDPDPINLAGQWATASIEVRATATWIVIGQLA